MIHQGYSNDPCFYGDADVLIVNPQCEPLGIKPQKENPYYENYWGTVAASALLPLVLPMLVVYVVSMSLGLVWYKSQTVCTTLLKIVLSPLWLIGRFTHNIMYWADNLGETWFN